jgi:SAM-dependent methyltransferase
MVEREWNRLDRDEFHRLEYNTTWRFLRKYLPDSGLVLDAGGGPGRYTVELAAQGYDVVLLDLVPENLQWARAKIRKAGVEPNVKDIVEGTITDLSRFKTNSFDAVVCLGGPLSHVCPESERRKAISELIRVAKRNASVFVSVISKYGVLIATPGGWPQSVIYKEMFDEIITTGDDYHFVRDGFCHFFTSAELERIFTDVDVDVLQKIGLEGFNSDEKLTNEFAANYPEAWKNWLEIHDRLCTAPFVVDASGHMMIIVRKK